jgi:hypothetical protein
MVINPQRITFYQRLMMRTNVEQWAIDNLINNPNASELFALITQGECIQCPLRDICELDLFETGMEKCLEAIKTWAEQETDIDD